MIIAEWESQDLIQDLLLKLQGQADPKTKQWFDNYLQGAIEYRGLKTPEVKKLLIQWHQQHQLEFLEPVCQLAICTELIAGKFAEDKFAGTIYVQRFLLKKLAFTTILDWSVNLFQQGYFYDWSTTDWFCTRILDPLIIQSGLDGASIVASWRNAENLWQRRAAIVAFRNASRQQKYHPLIYQIIEVLVSESERFIQTGIGWTLADMSKHYPQEAESLFRKYLTVLDSEVLTRHTKHLACHQELKQLKRSLAKASSEY